MEDILAAFRPSTIRQYESHWKAFQSFLREKGAPLVTNSIILEFLSYLAHFKGRSPSNIATHLAALADPLKFGWDITLEKRTLTLLKRGVFHQNPPPRRGSPFWSLSKVLSNLSPPTFPDRPPTDRQLDKALFLVALATGFRSSQLRALTRFPQWTSFSADMSLVSLALSPKVLGKNERLDHRLQPILLPAWRENGLSHPLCPVASLHSYLHNSPAADSHFLFCHPNSGAPLSTKQIAARIRQVIESADPGHFPRAHDLRGVSASLAFLRTHSLESVREGGQWTTSTCFINKYLSHSITDTPCIALGMSNN